MSRWPRGEAQIEQLIANKAQKAIRDAGALLRAAQQLLPTLSIF